MPNHLPEYLSEVAGTAIMMLIGVGAIALMWADVSPMPGLIESPDLRPQVPQFAPCFHPTPSTDKSKNQ